MAEFFSQNLIAVFFFYGLAFFCMGLAIYLELGHSSEMYFAQALRPLSWFGIIHGSHEWLEMFLILKAGQGGQFDLGIINTLRLIFLATSFCMLITFGVWLVAVNLTTRQKLALLGLAASIYLVGLIWLLLSNPISPSSLAQADVYTRYSLAIPGAVLACWGLLLQRRRFVEVGLYSFGRDVVIAAMAFAFYGGVGQLFASPTTLFPSDKINSEVFLNFMGFPIQVFRAIMAMLAAVFIIRSLRAFEAENRQRIEQLQASQLAEQRNLENLRGELFQRTVRAQEAERQRIARELHDGIGQTLTALGLGIRGLVDKMEKDAPQVTTQAKQLQEIATSGLDELRHMVNGLHPPHLDDLGFVSAIRALGREVNEMTGLNIIIENEMHGIRLSPEVRVVLFRIVQEALTNIVRHAHASQATIRIAYEEDHISLSILDDGQGFDSMIVNQDRRHPKLGLLGMAERASSIGGTCQVQSSVGGGTLVRVQAPLSIHESPHG